MFLRVSERVDDRRGDPPRYTQVDADDASLLARDYTLTLGRGPNRYVIAYHRTLKTQIPLHRLIVGALAGEIVDHIDRDTTNNTRANLRLVTQSENMRNRSLSLLR